jgi:hypothetical protein
MKLKFYIIGPRLNHITDNTTLQFSILCLVIGSLAGTKSIYSGYININSLGSVVFQRRYITILGFT